MTNETIMICNRGFGKKEHAIQVYTFKQETDRLACLKQLQTITSGENLDKLLLEQAVLTNDFIDQKPQYKRNCTWTSRESALLALFSLILQKKIPDQIACIQKAKRVYKAFTTYAREMSLKKYLIGSPKPNPELLALIKPKIPTNKHFTSRQKSTLIKLVNKYSKGPTLAVVHQEEKAPL